MNIYNNMAILDDLTNRIFKIKNFETHTLASNVYSENNYRVVLLGIGNESREDDGFGPFIINSIINSNSFKNLKFKKNNVMLLNCGEVPESFTGKITKFVPSHVILIDVAKMGCTVGDMRIIECSEIKGLGISTHQLPLNLFTDYLKKETGADIFLIGVEPERINFSTNLSEKVKCSANLLIEDLISFLHNFNR